MSNLAQILLNPCYSLDDTLFESRCAYPETYIDILGKHTIQSGNHSCLQSTLIHHNASFQFDNDCHGVTASFRLVACIGWKVRGWYRPHNYWFIPRWWPCLEEFGHSQIAVLLGRILAHLVLLAGNQVQHLQHHYDRQEALQQDHSSGPYKYLATAG